MSQTPEPIDLRDAFFGTVHEIARQDPRVVFLTADMGAWSLTQFREELPDQFLNVGISEQNMVSVAAGLALDGKRPFVYAIIPFLALRCLEQIKVDVCAMDLPVTLIGGGPGLTYASDGPTHHALEDVAVVRSLPHIAIYNPSDQTTANGAARLAHQGAGPCYVRVDKGALPLLHRKDADLSAGAASLRRGRDVLLVASGTITHTALDIADRLGEQGIDAGVVDLFRIKPLNSDFLVEEISGHPAVVTIEEHTLLGGIGSALCELLADAGVSRPVHRVGLSDDYCFRYGDRDWMRAHYGLGASGVAARVALWLAGAAHSARLDGIAEPDVRDLTADDFARLLGVPVDSLPPRCTEIIGTHDFRYRLLGEAERDRVILDVVSMLDSGQLLVAGEQEKWERGWSENLSDFVESQYDLASLTPKYIRHGVPIRLFSDFVQPLDPSFELNWYTVFRWWFFGTYMAEVEDIFEFGCGPAYNLPILSDLFPGRKIYGLDWAEASCAIVEKLREVHGLNVEGRRLDMFQPDDALPLTCHSGVLTLGALEQLGNRFPVFIDYLIHKSPRICAHMEPLRELYDERNLPDYLAKRFHLLRGYLGDLVAYLKALEAQGKVRIVKVHRVRLGSLFHEGYSYVVWRPVCGAVTMAAADES